MADITTTANNRPVRATTEHSLAALEWEFIQSALAKRTRSTLGHEAANHHVPLPSAGESRRFRERVLEALILVQRSPIHGYLSGVEDTTTLFDRASREGLLKPEEVWLCGFFMGTVGLLAVELRSRAAEAPRWAADFEHAPAAPPLCPRINDSVSSAGEILDTASSELARLRRERGERRAQFEQTLNQKIKEWDGRGLLQDNYYDVVDGRYVVPVKIEQQSKLDGALFGRSNTGQSVFIEPAELTIPNNALKEIELAIRAEEYRILHKLSNEIGAFAETYLQWVEIVAELDLALAAAVLAHDWRLSAPQVVENPKAVRLQLHEAFHPELKDQQVDIVTNSFSLGDSENPGGNALLISGPNTGGKTVLLKAVALSACMANAGLLIPAADGSVLPHYREVLAFIGDEQDLTAGLSSFSAQIMDMRAVLERTGGPFLIVIDEMLSSTGPEEASALAQALIEEFVARGHHVLVTSHFSELSLRCKQHPRIAVAAMEFNDGRPTYRLRPDELGSSHALDVARRLGISDKILGRARSLMSTAKLDYEKAVQELKKKETEVEAALHAERRRLEKEKNSAREEFNQKLADFVAQTQARVHETVEALTTRINTYLRQGIGGASPGRTLKKAEARIEANVDAVLDDIHAAAAEARGAPLSPGRQKALAIEVGSLVRVRSMAKAQGEVLALKGEGRDAMATIQVGNFRLEKPVSDLDPIQLKPETKVGRHYVGIDTPSSVPARLDLRGRRYDDAIVDAEHYIDQAFRSGMPSVTVVTGHGTGALKKGLKELLAGLPYVREFHPERGNDDGATVVEFDR